MPDIFDQVAGGTAPKGDIFDQVAPTKKPSPFRDVIEKAFNALYGMNLGQGEEALYGTPTGRAPSAPGKMGFFEKNVIPESPPVPLSEREMYLSPTPGAPPRPQESIRSGEPAPAINTLKAHGKNILSAADQVHAHTMDLMAGLGKIIEEAVPGYSGTWLKQKYQELAQKDRELAEEFKTNPQGAADKLTKVVLQGVVSLGDPTLPLMMNPAAYGTVSAIAAYGQGKPIDQSIIDGLKSGIVAKGFGKVHGLKPSEAAGKMGAIGATEAATGTPGGLEEKALAGLEGGITQGIFGGMAASRLGPKGREAYKTNAPIVGHEKALEIARTVEAQQPPKGDIFDQVAGVSTELRTEKPTMLAEAEKPDTSFSPGEFEPRAAARRFPDIGESPKGIPARKTPPIITTEQKKRQAKAKAVKEQQLKIESAEDAKKAVHSMIRERRYRLNLATYESNLFINEIERATSREQREVIPFIIENTDVPKGLNRPDLEKIHAAEKANLAPIARQVKDHFDKGWQRMKESTPDMSAEQIEDYVTHIWDVPKSKKREVTSWFTTQNRFLKKRFIETINEGVEKFGLQPKTLDISEIIRIHDSVMNRVIENNRFVEDLKKLRKDGVPLIERADKAPQDWAYFDHPALRRGLIIPGEAKMGEKVSPELADILAEMGVAIGRRISPVTFGKPTWKAGEYRPGDTPEVRFQRFMSNRTIAHEIGHHLDAALGLGDKFLNKYKTELYEVNRKRIESFAGTDKEAYAKSTEEQIAEFFAILFTNPDLASRVAPTATADALTRLKGDGVLTKLVDFDFEKNAKNLIEERLDTMVKLPVKVHPDLEAPLKVIFESRMTHPAIQAFETMNGILKKTELSLSLFHHVALGETGIGTMGLPKTLGIYFNPVKIFKAMWRGEYDIYKKEPIARDAIEHGLQVGATSDIPVNMIQTKLNDMARKTRNVLVINKAMALLRTFNEQWDKALWNYLHDTLKLQGYESLCAKMDPTKDIKAQKEEIAQFVNDTFGGQNWDVLMVSPKSLQLMSWFLLSPDWTLSTLRQALAPTGIGTIHKEAGSALRKKMGAHFWVKAGLYFGLGINMLNHMNRKRDEKEHPEYYEGEDRGFFDRTMAGNAIGHKTHLFAGRYDDGTERYVRWGKQFRELPEMFFDDTGFSPISATIKKIGGKMAPALQLASSILTGSSLSGFRNDDINGKEGWDKVYGIAKTVMKSPFPFSSRTMFDENKEFHFTDVAMPSSKGMTRYRSIELFKVAIEKDDERLLKEVYQDTLRNNLPAYTLFNASLAQLKAESTNEYNEGLKSIADVQERAKDIKSPIEAARLARVMRRMIKENADRMAGIRLLDAAILNLKKYQVLSEAEAKGEK